MLDAQKVEKTTLFVFFCEDCFVPTLSRAPEVTSVTISQGRKKLKIFNAANRLLSNLLVEVAELSG